MFASLGINYKCARQDIRDNAGLVSRERTKLLQLLLQSGIRGGLVLSTCNRSEIFFVGDNDKAITNAANIYEQVTGVKPLEIRRDEEAIEYFFRIASGLESQVIGEDQILGQVKTAYGEALKGGFSCRELNLIAHAAITTAKSIKAQFPIDEIPPSIASHGVNYLASITEVRGKSALVIGRGKIATLAAQELQSRGALVTICNRTAYTNTVAYDLRYELAEKSEIVVSATASPHTILKRDQLKLTHPTIFLDLASPRDIDPAIATLPDAKLIDLDQLDSMQAYQIANGRKELIDNSRDAIATAMTTLSHKLTSSSKHEYRIGTRGSKLALVQAEFVREQLKRAYPEDEFKIVIITTHGDVDTKRSIASIGDNALFTGEIEKALLANQIDLAVHSMKDLASSLPTGLTLAKAWTREDCRDVIVSKNGLKLCELPSGATIATGSVRRNRLIARLRPDITIVDIRGNVDTRLRKLFAPNNDEPKLDAIVLAAAGLKRLGLADKITEYLNPKTFIPAANQGTLAIQLRDTDTELLAKIDALGDDTEQMIAEAERGFLYETGANCHQPVAAHCEIVDAQLVLDCMFAEAIDSPLKFVTIKGQSPSQLAKEAACLVK